MLFRSKSFHLTNLILVTYIILISFLVILLILICLSEVPLKSAVISSASSQAEVATAAGEVAKDAKYLNIVNNNGDDFIPLVCETFGA